ncbi:MAG: hypothetical protein M3R08_02295, partial [Bacteroidota bacterium]|nr:hypothetical protein [Bacteroidota bacterium]
MGVDPGGRGQGSFATGGYDLPPINKTSYSKMPVHYSSRSRSLSGWTRLLFSSMFVLGMTLLVQGQCLIATYGQYPFTTYTPACSGGIETITASGYAGEFSSVSLIAGVAYTFRSGTADYITISNAAGTTALAFGNTPRTYTPTATATYRFYSHVNSACGSQEVDRVRSISCTSGCLTASQGQYPAATFTPSCTGTQEVIATDAWAAQYSMVALTAGVSYTFTSSFNDFITISNAAGNQSVAYGSSPRTYTPTVSGSYRFYLHTNSSCQEQFINRTKAVTCTSNSTGCLTASHGQFPANTFIPSCSGNPQTISTTAWAGQYSMVALTAGVTYTFTSGTNDHITISDAAGTSVLVYGGTPRTYTPTTTGSYRFYSHTNGACGEESTNRTRAVSCPNTGFNGCLTATAGQIPGNTYTPTCTGTNEVITTQAWAGSYSKVALTAGTAYTFISGSDLMTISDEAGVNVMTYGVNITYTPTTTGIYRFYSHVNAACAEDFTDRTRSISCTAPNAGCLSAPYGQWPTNTYQPACTGTTEIVATDWAGSYSKVALVAGELYTFTSGTTDHITIANDDGTVALAYATTPISYIPTVTGTYRFYSHTNFVCGVQTVDRNRTITCSIAPAPCTSASPLNACGVSQTVTLSGIGVMDPNCGSSAPGNEKIYTYTPTETGTHHLLLTAVSNSTLNFYWKLASDNCTATGWNCIGTAFSPSVLDIPGWTAGVPILFLVDAETMNSMTASFRIECPQPPPANDNCSNATEITSLPYTSGLVSNILAGDDSPPSQCAGPYKNIWWTVPGICGTMTASTCNGSNFNTTIAVFAGNCQFFNAVACNEDNGPSCSGTAASVSWTGIEGLTYYISVGTSDVSSEFGNIQLSVSALDTDGDGIYDACDDCPNNAGVIGSPCDDGLACTIDDVLNANCECAGTSDANVPVTVAATPAIVCAGGSTQLLATVPGGLLQVVISGSTWMDEISWTLTNASNSVIASVTNGTYYSQATYTHDVAAENGPFVFFLETMGSFNDNDATYTITCDGTTLITGTLQGGNTFTQQGINCSGGGTFVWTPAAGLNDATIADPIATLTEETTYTVTVSNDGCTGTASITVMVDLLCADCAGVPNGPAVAGTPCDDGDPDTSNDTWSAGCICLGQPVVPDPCNTITTIDCGVPQTVTLSGNGAGWNQGACSSSQPIVGEKKIFTFTPTVSGEHWLEIQSVANENDILYSWKYASDGCDPDGWNCIVVVHQADFTFVLPYWTAGEPVLIMMEAEIEDLTSHTIQIKCPGTSCYQYSSIQSLPFSTAISNSVSPDQGPVTSCTGSTNNMWWLVEGICGTMTASTCGSNFDTEITVFTGYCHDLVEVICNDNDGLACAGSNASVSWNATQGEYYFIMVGGANMAAGTGNIALSVTAPNIVDTDGDGLADACDNCPNVAGVIGGNCDLNGVSGELNAQCECIAIDPCGNAIALNACGTPQTVTLNGNGIWNIDACGFSTPGKERIFTYTPTETGIHVLQVTSTVNFQYFDYFWKLASDGCSDTGWNCIDDISGPTSSILPSWTAGVPLLILVDSESDDNDTHTFQINCPVPVPANDDCANATAITSLPFTSPFINNTSATNDFDDLSTCSGPRRNIWWTVTGVCGTMTASTCNSTFNTKMAVFTGSCGSFVEVGCENDGPICG